MIYKRAQAIEMMNTWGRDHQPFFFIIDFEMKAIQLLQTKNLTDDILFEFQGRHENAGDRRKFSFRKFPGSFFEYKVQYDQVISHIKAGNSFLVNLTAPTRIETDLSLRDIYEISQAKYKLLINDEFVCFSPETFVTIRDGYIVSCPMKGTIRAFSGAEDIILADVKETAEHHTIVDLIRNDLSIVSNDVYVKRFRYVEMIKTNQENILQVSSEIVGKLEQNYSSRLGEIIFALLPAGSVTGAPKKKTVEIIRQVEKEERGYYTGIFGCYDGYGLDSAVTIRCIENRNGTFRFRSGGGITWQSDAGSEYRELIDKIYVPVD